MWAGSCLLGRFGGVPTLGGTCFGAPCFKDCRSLGSRLGSPYLGKQPVEAFDVWFDYLTSAMRPFTYQPSPTSHLPLPAIGVA